MTNEELLFNMKRVKAHLPFDVYRAICDLIENGPTVDEKEIALIIGTLAFEDFVQDVSVEKIRKWAYKARDAICGMLRERGVEVVNPANNPAKVSG